MTEKEKLDCAIALVRKFVPELTVTKKSDSKLHKAIGWVLAKIGNKDYMKSYVTTIGTNIAVPNMGMSWYTVLHEGRHVIDFRETGAIPFSIAYLFPQIIGIVGLPISLLVSVLVLCGSTPWLLLSILSLVFLAPLPAPFRAYGEARAYTVTLAALFWARKLDDWKAVDAITQYFTTSCYYWMFPFKGLVRKYFEKRLAELKADTLELDSYLAACRVFAQLVK